MQKRILFILLFTSTFIVTGCLERGGIVAPTHTKQTSLTKKSFENKKVKNFQRATHKVIPIESITTKSSSIDTKQNTIAGILIMIIGVMVFI